jgi:UDP-2,4-diacetamido-2,4,6-trideoxy-beta-L-altropyranose hydrolase
MILFRTDATPQIGFGHLTRCRALAYAVREQGESSVMVGPDQTYANKDDARLFDVWLPQAWSDAEADAIHLAALAEQFGAKKLALDDYRVNEAYQRVLRDKRLKWLQFEARTTHPIWADIVLNASPAAKVEDYAPVLRNPDAQLLLGPRYAVLSPEFASVQPRNPRHPIRRVLVTFGGGDDRGATRFVLSALLPATPSDLQFMVISGAHNPRNAENLDWIKEFGQGRVSFDINPKSVASLFLECDLAVMAGGTSTYEAARCGLPMLLITIADNQTSQSKTWDDIGAAKWLGSLEDLQNEELINEFNVLRNNEQNLALMSIAGSRLVDGNGAHKIAKIFSQNSSLN